MDWACVLFVIKMPSFDREGGVEDFSEGVGDREPTWWKGMHCIVSMTWDEIGPFRSYHIVKDQIDTIDHFTTKEHPSPSMTPNSSLTGRRIYLAVAGSPVPE